MSSPEDAPPRSLVDPTAPCYEARHVYTAPLAAAPKRGRVRHDPRLFRPLDRLEPIEVRRHLGRRGGEASSGDPSKDAKLLGSCDRTGSFYLDCTESYAPSVGSDPQKECDTLGGKFRITPCPRINALTQCFEGNPPYLSGSYKYEGSKTTHSASDCPRGFRDYKKNPDLKANASPASCNGIAGGGVCLDLPGVSAASEQTCLDNGGSVKQPPEPCPKANGLTALSLKQNDGSGTYNWYFYTTPYTDAKGTHTWKDDDVALLCGLAGDNCKHIPFATGGTEAKTGASAAAPAKSAAPKPAPAPMKSAAPPKPKAK